VSTAVEIVIPFSCYNCPYVNTGCLDSCVVTWFYACEWTIDYNDSEDNIDCEASDSMFDQEIGR